MLAAGIKWGKNGRWARGKMAAGRGEIGTAGSIRCYLIQDGKEERDKWKKGLAAGLLAGRVCECDQLAAEPGDS